MNSNKNIPQLRFPEFTGEWEEKRLGEVANKINRKNTHLEISRVLTNSANVGVVDQNDYFDRDIAVKDNTANYHIVEYGDFVYNPRISTAAPVGPISINKVGRGIMSPLYTVFKFNKGYIPFYEQYFQTAIWHSYLKSIANFGARFDRMNITTEGFFNMPLYFPTSSEQQKIAECLSEMDNLIAAQVNKVDALKEKKKGMMQQMFPQKGETTPRLRFPGFTGEWDYVNGDELFEVISNKNHNSDLPILALTQDQGAVPRDMINYNVIVSDKSVAGYKVVEVDDFIISLRSFQGGIEYSRYKGLCSPAYIVLRKKSKELCSDFYRIYFKSFNYIQDLNKNLEGIRDGKMISYKQFSEIKLPQPIPSEQQKIAECLSAMDDMIASESAKLDALKDHKKGLMQQMFPQPNK